MEELRDLYQMAQNASNRFSVYDGQDFILPQSFKDSVKEINSNTIVYHRFSAIIETKGSQNGTLNIYLPNQWFYVASYFTDFYNELMKYKRLALKVASKERLKSLNGYSLNEDELEVLQSLDLSDESKENLIKFITDYSWWGGAKTIDRGDFFVSPILSHARLVNASQSFVADLCAFLSDKRYLVETILNGEDLELNEQKGAPRAYPLQQIFYGAPGTGKSHGIEVATKGQKVIRTTFHPDSDYATFVGAYKPVMRVVETMTVIGTKSVVVEDSKGDTVKEKKIEYDFIPQAFTEAYVEAWKDLQKPVYLVIEEINRGNCAQIFGDIFQLLDRNEYGFSSYTITPDEDLHRHLEEKFAQEGFDEDCTLDKSDILDIWEGRKMCLPPNLYIWATMNTSDQSLFPIDSAFKRRWDWKYVPIKYDNTDWKVMLGNQEVCKWTDLQQRLNDLIYDATESEDKMLGDWFVKADSKNEINEEQLVGKIVFYLWNDVAKVDAGKLFDLEIEKKGGKRKVIFSDFYKIDGKADTKIVEDWLKSINVLKDKSSEDKNTNEPEQ